MAAGPLWRVFSWRWWRPTSKPTARSPSLTSCSRILRPAKSPASLATMRILLASSEVFPYSKTGGLADMAGALAKYLAGAGHDVEGGTPLYRESRAKIPGSGQSGVRLKIPLGEHVVSAQVVTVQPMEGLALRFIDHPGFY